MPLSSKTTIQEVLRVKKETVIIAPSRVTTLFIRGSRVGALERNGAYGYTSS